MRIFINNSLSKYTKSLEQFQGYVVEKVDEKGREKILVVSSITQKEPLEETLEDVKSSEDHSNIIWFKNKENNFKGIQKGDKVAVWWDPTKPHFVPSILTLVAEKI